MKKTLFMIPFLCFLFVTSSITIHADTQQERQSQTSTDIRVELKRKILPGVLPGETGTNGSTNTGSISSVVTNNNSMIHSTDRNSVTDSKSHVSIASSTERLPKTGESISYWLTGLGVAVLGFFILLLIQKSKPQKGADQ